MADLVKQFKKDSLKVLEAERRLLREEHYARLQAWERMKELTDESNKEN